MLKSILKKGNICYTVKVDIIMKGCFFMSFEEKMIKSEYIYEGKILNLRKDEVVLPNGAMAFREVVEHYGGVCVVAINNKNEVLLVNQFRYPYKEHLLEIPAGKLNKGEDPLECGIRELKEETGAIAKNIIPLGIMYPSPGYCAEIIHIYLASDLVLEQNNLDEDEFLEVKAVPFSQALKMAANGEINLSLIHI